MMRYEGGRKSVEKRKSDEHPASSEGNLGFNYYIEQLHQISVEQNTVLSRQTVENEPENEPEEEASLDIFAKVLRLLWQTGEAYLDSFFSEAEHKLDLDMQKTYPALQRMQAAGLVAINEGKVCLTASGKELMADQ
jgi:coproporphyrinogen III oxidase-like Fe-S oxidoreductase